MLLREAARIERNSPPRPYDALAPGTVPFIHIGRIDDILVLVSAIRDCGRLDQRRACRATRSAPRQDLQRRLTRTTKIESSGLDARQ